MGIWRSLAGVIRIRITGADIPASLKLLTDRDVLLDDIVYISDLTAEVTLKNSDYSRAEKLLKKHGDSCVPASRWGLYWTVYYAKSRMVLLSGILILMFLTVYIPTRILFVQVKGNQNVSSLKILEKAEKNGLVFGADRAAVRSEHLKNMLLEDIPELDWVGITTAGCVATIEVKENVVGQPKENTGTKVSSILAVCDGVVESITVTNGTPLCKPGQAVRKGQVLISGYQDFGLLLKATDAKGEIFARTYRYIQAVSPVTAVSRREKFSSETNFSLQIGKKLINFCKDSGISPAGCVKMYSKKYLTLPGGFQLPAALVIEEVNYYETVPISLSQDDFLWMENSTQNYLTSQMIAGEVLQATTAGERLDQCYVFFGEYSCREQIGYKRIEENLSYNGENS